MNRPPERLDVQARRDRSKRPVNDRSDLSDLLEEGCGALALTLGRPERECLLTYLDLLQKWNRVYNLTAIRDPEQMLVQHLLDSLAVMPALQSAQAVAQASIAPDARQSAPPTLLDVGSGAGLPGLVLAVAWPELEADLVEPVGKKAAFLRQSAAELGLSRRVRVHGCRVEQVVLARSPDLAICRAFSSLADFTSRLEPLATHTTQVFAMKAQLDEIRVEQAALSSRWQITDIIPLTVPGLAAARHLVRLTQSTQTSL